MLEPTGFFPSSMRQIVLTPRIYYGGHMMFQTGDLHFQWSWTHQTKFNREDCYLLQEELHDQFIHVMSFGNG